MKNAIIIIFFIFFCFTHASGGNAVFFPPASVGRGGSVQAIAEPGSFFYNPACAPVVASWSLYGWYGFSADTSIAVLEMVFPIAPLYYGTTVAYGWQEDEHEHVAHKWSAGAIGCGGDIVRSVNWGVSLQFFQKDETSSSFITAIRCSVFWTHVVRSMGVGFGIYSISLGFSHGEVVFAEHEDTAWFDPRMSSIGAGLLLYKRSHVSLRIASEFDAMWSYQSYNAKGGGEIIFFDKLFTRFGVQSNTKNGDAYLMCGIGGKVQFFDHIVKCDYSFAYHAREKIHYMSAGTSFCGIDAIAPRVTLEISSPAFSPNGDGNRDEIVFFINAVDENALKGWVLQILDSKGQVVREFRSRKHSPLTKFYISPLSVFSRSGSVAIPHEFHWDGTDNMGKVQSDGEYYYSFYAWDEFDNISRAIKGKCIVDTISPAIVVRSAQLCCVPGKRPVELEIDFIKNHQDSAWATLYDAKGREIIKWHFDNDNIHSKVIWNGFASNGKVAENGSYTLIVVAQDDAGNRTECQLNNIVVTGEEFDGDIVIDKYYFSPHKDGSVKISPKFWKKVAHDEWKLIISREDGEVVFEKKGKGMLPFCEWNGTDSSGKLCKDGMYFIKMQVTKDEINFATTLQKSIIIDSTPPRGSIHFSLKEFTPDDDCYKDQIIIHPYAIDKYSVEKWEVNVFDNNGEIIKKFMGSGGVPKALRWNGRLRDGSIPFTFEKFNVQFTAWDKAGNEMQTLNDTFSTGLVVALEGNQQHIVFSNEGIFRNDNEDATLLRFLRVLGRKIRYLAPEKVHIEVHSDFEGDDDVNLLKTEKVAAFVKDFLVSYGIDEKIISFRGMGETKPLYPEGSGKLRNKNNRIEIFLHYGN